jgi:hypothetical protein
MTIVKNRGVTAFTLAVSLGLLATFASAEPAGPSNAWLGTWKLDPARSKLAGYTFSYAKNTSGGYHFTDGSTVSYDFAIDGKEYPAVDDRKIAWTSAGDHAWDSVTKANGRVLAKVHRVLSGDGKTLTVDATGTNADGTPFHDLKVFKRLSGSDGLVGKWIAIKDDSDAPSSFILSAPVPGTLRWEVPAWQAVTEGALDGTDHPIKGDTQPPGLTHGGRLESPMKISYVLKINGKPQQYGVQTLAPDGKSFTDVSWNPGKEGEKSVALYVKQ